MVALITTERWRLIGASVALLIAATTAATVVWQPQQPHHLVELQGPTIVQTASPAANPPPAVAAEVQPPPEPLPAARPQTAAPYQCGGTTRSGRQCKRMIRTGEFCYQHKPK